MADFFEETQWGETKPENADENWPNDKLFEAIAKIRTDEFDLEELDKFLKNAKNAKSPGTDGIPMEFYKWLDENGRTEVLKILNKLWNEEWFLENMEEADVVTLYKKGNVEDVL